MTTDTLMLAGAFLVAIAVVAWLEHRAATRRKRHDDAIRRVCWPDSPPARPSGPLPWR